MSAKIAKTAAWPLNLTLSGTDADGTPVNATLALDADGKLTVVEVQGFTSPPPGDITTE